MSDPPPSRPRRCALLGGSKTSPTCAFGSSMNIGPKTATSTKSPMIVTPTIAWGFDRIAERRNPGVADSTVSGAWAAPAAALTTRSSGRA